MILTPVELQKLANEWAIMLCLDPLLATDGIIGPKSQERFSALDAKEPGWRARHPQYPYMVDSLAPVTEDTITILLDKIGWLPTHYGRYINLVSPVELERLAVHGIKWVPIALHPYDVGKTSDIAKKQSENDIHALKKLLESSRVMMSSRIFLDIEQTPTLSADYYTGFAAAWIGTALPATYIPDPGYWPEQWVALQNAIKNGAAHHGAWCPRYIAPCNGRATFCMPQWDMPNHAILAWQYLGNAYHSMFDFSRFRPGFDPEDL